MTGGRQLTIEWSATTTIERHGVEMHKRFPSTSNLRPSSSTELALRASENYYVNYYSMELGGHFGWPAGCLIEGRAHKLNLCVHPFWPYNFSSTINAASYAAEVER